MKKLMVLLAVTILLSGCVSFGTSPRVLNVTWTNRTNEVASLSLDDEANPAEVIVMEKKAYGYTKSTMDITMAEIEASMSGDTSGEFEFDLTTSNPYEKVANNTVWITPLQAEKGSVLVSSEGQKAIIEYEIFPSATIPDQIPPMYPKYQFDFKLGERVEKGHIRAVSSMDNKLIAEIATIDIEEGFWGEFPTVNNLHEYEYEEQEFYPDFFKIYLIKCGDDGYAAMRFTANAGTGWNFIYKFSETGVFE